MRNILKLILSAVILFRAVPTINAMDMNMLVWKKLRRRKRRKVRRLVKKVRSLRKVSSQKSSEVSRKIC